MNIKNNESATGVCVVIRTIGNKSNNNRNKNYAIITNNLNHNNSNNDN